MIGCRIEFYQQPEAESLNRITLKDGRIFEHFLGSMHVDGEVIARLERFRDITIEEKVRRELRQEVGFRRTIISTLPDLIWLKDPDGVYLAGNKRFEEFIGATEQEYIGKTDYDLVDASLADSFREYDNKAMQSGLHCTNEEWINFASDGHRELLEIIKTPMYDDGGKLIGIRGIGHNITARRESEEKLKTSEERFSLAMRGTNDGLWDWDLETNQAYYSPRWKAMLGFASDELDNNLSTWARLAHADDKDLVLKKLGCDTAQGYLFGDPATARLASKLLE